MITENTFQIVSQPMIMEASRLEANIFIQLSELAEAFAEDPDQTFNEDQFVLEQSRRWDEFRNEVSEWNNENLAKAYKRGIETTNGDAEELGLGAPSAGAFSTLGLLRGNRSSQDQSLPPTIAQKAKDILEEYPEHHAPFSQLKQAIDEDIAKTRLPVIRDVRDKVRDIDILRGDQAYRSSNTFTRRKMTQDLMDDFVRNGIKGVQYRDGRVMGLRGYSEMVARTQTGNAIREAKMNRWQEFGEDLVIVSVHFPTASLCRPWQGRVFSLSGQHPEYPPFSEAINGGLYHANCKHSHSGFVEGQSEELNVRDRKKPKKQEIKRSKAIKDQRYNERQIRHWKLRKRTAVTDEAKQKATRKVTQWQKRQREHVSEWEHLKRKYHREQLL